LSHSGKKDTMRRCHPDQSDRPVLLDVLWWPGRMVPVRQVRTGVSPS
jgi:hypothetical protein